MVAKRKRALNKGPDCGRSDFKVEVAEFGDVEIICGFCEGELIHVPCEVIMYGVAIDGTAQIVARC